MLERFLAGRINGSVLVNGLLIPLNRLAQSLQRFCVPAMFYSHDQSWEMTKKGTALLLRFGGRNYALFAKHQLEESKPALAVSPKDFSILVTDPEGRRRAVTPDAAVSLNFDNPRHANLDDLILLEYSDHRLGGQFSRYFLDMDLEVTRDDVADAAVLASFAIGYPTCAVDWGVSEDGRMEKANIPWVIMYLADEPSQPLDPDNRRILMQVEPDKQKTLPDPDGMSGAPVFSVLRGESSKLELVFAGLVTNGRGRRFAVYPGGYIREALLGTATLK